MKILGIDPGLSITGYGVIDTTGNNPHFLTYGVIKKNPKASFPENLLSIYQEIKNIVSSCQPDACAIENIFYHQNKKTAIIMGHVRGVAIVAAAERKIPVFEYSPREIKLSIVGQGGASKTQVQSMIKNILQMKEIPFSEDASDALAVAVCHFHRLKMRAYLRK
ncbi:MAG: crossover junction endodeoxyribonuclease RuvC [Calditrichaeota bacterium]|nr:crossover junction endodeoxyribonuclease RuvC [Calditrichota bacterium]RQW03240.1 MAG: crossover junction endodeoxyribonuclease RuvC [Calditrichota bacterium]